MRAPDDVEEERRFPSRVYGQGEEPDPRFTLANERTFLAWMRTSLALIAGGVALAAVDLAVPRMVQMSAAGLLLVVGLAAPILAWRHWASVETAMRLVQPLPSFKLTLLISVALGLVAALLLVGVVVGQ